MQSIDPRIEIIAADERGLPVVIGVPFTRGTLSDDASLAVIAPSD